MFGDEIKTNTLRLLRIILTSAALGFLGQKQLPKHGAVSLRLLQIF